MSERATEAIDTLASLERDALPLDGMCVSSGHANARWAFERAMAAHGSVLLAIARAAVDLLEYYDNLDSHGTNQRPDLGVRVARLDTALRALGSK